MNNFITIAYRKRKISRFFLKIKQFFFLKSCKKQFKKDLKNDVYFTKIREENPISFNLKEYLNNHFNEVYFNERTNNN